MGYLYLVALNGDPLWLDQLIWFTRAFLRSTERIRVLVTAARFGRFRTCLGPGLGGSSARYFGCPVGCGGSIAGWPTAFGDRALAADAIRILLPVPRLAEATPATTVLRIGGFARAPLLGPGVPVTAGIRLRRIPVRVSGPA